MGELVKVMLWSWCCCGSGLCGSIRLMSKSKSWDSCGYGGVCCGDDHGTWNVMGGRLWRMWWTC